MVEKEELERRFIAAVNDAKSRGCELELNALTDACRASKAVFNCTLERLQRSVASGTEVFETYYDLERLRIRSENSGGIDWERFRPQAEIELLGSDRHKDRLFYSLLSIDGDGLTSYGECTSVLKESMIARTGRHALKRTRGSSGRIGKLFRQVSEVFGAIGTSFAPQNLVTKSAKRRRLSIFQVCF